MANKPKRGRPPKKRVEETEEKVVETTQEDISKEKEEVSQEDTTMDEIKEFMQPSEDKEPTFNPLMDDVVEREYSSPKIAEGVVEDLDEPIFQQETYSDLTDAEEEFDDPLQDPNPALHDLSDKDKRKSSEYLADATLGAYAMLLKLGSNFVQVSDADLVKKADKYNVDLNDTISVDGVHQMSISEFMQYYNQEIDRAMAYDPAFGKEAKPLLMEIFAKKGWGLTPEQKLLLLFGSDIASKVIVASQLSRQIDKAFEMKGMQPNIKAETSVEDEVVEKSAPTPTEEVIPDEVDDMSEYTKKSKIDFDDNPLRETKRTMHTHAKAPKVEEK